MLGVPSRLIRAGLIGPSALRRSAVCGFRSYSAVVQVNRIEDMLT